MIIPGDYDLTLYRGRKQAWRAACCSDDQGNEATPLTGYTAAAAIRPVDGGEPRIELSAIVVDDADNSPADGLIEFGISAEDSAQLTGTYYSWTAVVIDSVGQHHPILKGKVHVKIDDTL
jgi:hypothetical protein